MACRLTDRRILDINIFCSAKCGRTDTDPAHVEKSARKSGRIHLTHAASDHAQWARQGSGLIGATDLPLLEGTLRSHGRAGVLTDVLPRAIASGLQPMMPTETELDASAPGYRLLTYQDQGRPVAGLLTGSRVYPAQLILQDTGVDASSVLSLLESWPIVRQALADSTQSLPSERGALLADVSLLAPILYPRAIFCAGANYWDHAEEMGGAIDRSQRPTSPWFFLKTSAHSVVGNRARVRLPTMTRQLDWEAELAVVIGKHARNVPAERAVDVIAGYTILNDLSARDLMVRADRPAAMTFDWIGQKCFDGAAPMGPWITPAAFVPDCHQLAVNLWVNGVLKQSSNTNQLIHSVFEQIEWLSHQLTLLPGDVIATGTPAGVGAPRGDFLSKGDTVTIELESCGRLTNTIV